MFPSTLSTFTNPTANDRLNSPSHSAIERQQNSTIGQIETIIGTDSSIIGTIIGDLRNSNSDGGGHIQTAVKGGTGQTQYNKGDLLVGQSSSVLTKVAVGTQGQLLSVDSATATGVRWATNTSPKVATSASTMSFLNTVVSVMSVTITGSTLGTGNAIKGTVYVRDYSDASVGDTIITAKYGTASISATITNSDIVSVSSISGTLSFNLIANAANNSQRGILIVDLSGRRTDTFSASVIGANVYRSSLMAIDSGADQTFGIEVRNTNSGAAMTTDGYITERIT